MKLAPFTGKWLDNQYRQASVTRDTRTAAVRPIYMLTIEASAGKKAMLVDDSIPVGSRNVNKLIDNQSAISPG